MGNFDRAIEITDLIPYKNDFRSKALFKISNIMCQKNEMVLRAQNVVNLIDSKSEYKAKALFNISEY